MLKLVCLARIEPPGSWQRIVPLAKASSLPSFAPSSSRSVSDATLDSLCHLIEKGAETLEHLLVDRIQLDTETVLHFALHPRSHCPVCLMCVADVKCSNNQIQAFFNFMRTLVEDDLEVEALVTSCAEFGLQDKFGACLEKEILDFNKRMAARQDQVAELQKQVAEVKTVMSDNVARVLERGDRLDNLDTRAEALQQSSQSFKTTAHRVQRHMCFKNLKWTIILSIVIALLVILVLYFALKSLGVFN